jgi:hypothetical protein
MSMYSWIRNAFTSRMQTRSTRTSRKCPKRWRPVLESLEDRVTPSAVNLAAPETYIENMPLNLVDIVIGDTVNATATLTLSDATAGSLSTATSGAVTSTYNSATGVWSASGPVADVNALLAGVIFTPALNYNLTFHIGTSVVDDGGTFTGDKVVTGTAVNNAPVVTVPGAQTTAEDVAVKVSGISVSDVDVNEGTGQIKVTLSVNSGKLSVGTSVVGGLTAAGITGSGTGTVVLQGPIAEVNATLAAGVTYLGNLNFHGTDTLTVLADDLGNTGSGGAQTGSATVSIHVLSPTEQVAALRVMVQELADEGLLNKGQANALLTKLRHIDAALAKNHGKVAFNVAGAFLNQLRAFTHAGILTTAQSAPLITAAIQLRQSLMIGGFQVAHPAHAPAGPINAPASHALSSRNHK